MTTVSTPPAACTCKYPLPKESATRKGAVASVCARCGGRITLTLSRPAA